MENNSTAKDGVKPAKDKKAKIASKRNQQKSLKLDKLGLPSNKGKGRKSTAKRESDEFDQVLATHDSTVSVLQEEGQPGSLPEDENPPNIAPSGPSESKVEGEVTAEEMLQEFWEQAWEICANRFLNSKVSELICIELRDTWLRITEVEALPQNLNVLKQFEFTSEAPAPPLALCEIPDHSSQCKVEAPIPTDSFLNDYSLIGEEEDEYGSHPVDATWANLLRPISREAGERMDMSQACEESEEPPLPPPTTIPSNKKSITRKNVTPRRRKSPPKSPNPSKPMNSKGKTGRTGRSKQKSKKATNRSHKKRLESAPRSKSKTKSNNSPVVSKPRSPSKKKQGPPKASNKPLNKSKPAANSKSPTNTESNASKSTKSSKKSKSKRSSAKASTKPKSNSSKTKTKTSSKKSKKSSKRKSPKKSPKTLKATSPSVDSSSSKLSKPSKSRSKQKKSRSDKGQVQPSTAQTAISIKSNNEPKDNKYNRLGRQAPPITPVNSAASLYYRDCLGEDYYYGLYGEDEEICGSARFQLRRKNSHLETVYGPKSLPAKSSIDISLYYKAQGIPPWTPKDCGQWSMPDGTGAYRSPGSPSAATRLQDIAEIDESGSHNALGDEESEEEMISLLDSKVAKDASLPSLALESGSTASIGEKLEGSVRLTPSEKEFINQRMNGYRLKLLPPSIQVDYKQRPFPPKNVAAPKKMEEKGLELSRKTSSVFSYSSPPVSISSKDIEATIQNNLKGILGAPDKEEALIAGLASKGVVLPEFPSESDFKRRKLLIEQHHLYTKEKRLFCRDQKSRPHATPPTSSTASHKICIPTKIK